MSTEGKRIEGSVSKADSRSWMNLRSIEIFVAAVEGGSMSRAAERLGLTQSAVSQAIANMESAVGRQLIDRSVRPLKLTLAGASFFKKATELLDRARELEQFIELDLNKALPVLRIGMVDSFAATAGPHLVQKLDAIASQWSVGSGLNDTSLRALIERRVDFMISPDDSHRQFDVVAIPIFEEPFLIAAPTEWGDDVEQMMGEKPLIRYNSRSFIGRQVDSYLQQQTFIPEQRYELDTSDAVLAMVAARIGWSITTPLALLKSSPSMQRMSCYPLPAPGMHRKLWLMARQTESPELAERIAEAAREAINRYCLPKMRKLAPWLADQLQDNQA